MPALIINVNRRRDPFSLPIDEALKAEANCLYQATSQTPAIKRFTIADEKGLEHDMENQRNWNDLVIGVQDIK